MRYHQISASAILLWLLGGAVGLTAGQACSTERNPNPAAREIEMSREYRKEHAKKVPHAARVPVGIVEIAARGSVHSMKEVAQVFRAIEDAAGPRGLRVVGTVPIPEEEVSRLHSTPGTERRLWLCREDEAPYGPCLISVTLYRPADGVAATKAFYRVWALAGATDDQLDSAADAVQSTLETAR